MVNPSLVTVNRTRIAVPHANFSVHVFNESAKEFQHVKSVVLCELEIDSCWLHTPQVIRGHSISFMLVQRNDSANSTAKYFAHFGNHTAIQSAFQRVSYAGFDPTHGAMFAI